MKQYLITALDFTDENALDRRMSARPLHLEKMKEFKEKKCFIMGGAILNQEGQMIGSSLIMPFDTDQQLSAWLSEEPYLLLKVWEKVEVKDFKVANI